jgi:hypothetical protein
MYNRQHTVLFQTIFVDYGNKMLPPVATTGGGFEIAMTVIPSHKSHSHSVDKFSVPRQSGDSTADPFKIGSCGGIGIRTATAGRHGQSAAGRDEEDQDEHPSLALCRHREPDAALDSFFFEAYLPNSARPEEVQGISTGRI